MTERTYSKDEAVISFTERGLSCFGKTYDIWYKGDWAVYDLVTEKFVSGATGSHYSLINGKGRYFQFKDAENNGVALNENGETLPEGAKLFDDGSYSIEDRAGAVYNDDGELLFNYDLTGYIPCVAGDGYYVARKYVDGSVRYVVMDTTGKIISSEFNANIIVYGDIVCCDNKVYTLEGKAVLEGTYESVYCDKTFGRYWMLRNGDDYTVIDKNGNVLFKGTRDDDHSVWPDDFTASKTVDGDNYYYSYKDKDYTVKGYRFAPWIVKTRNNNSLYDLVDTTTGKKLLEGYSDYTGVSKNSSAYYVYAKYNGGIDVYLVVSNAQLESVINKKNALFDDLAAAFTDEGISVTVNKETGEIALDSSVLFGGDSAELTNDGKAFLNEFIKVYTAVAFSDEYEGFISKTMVEGHVAPVEGSTYANGLQLSEERALNVKNYCLSVDTGVDVSKIGKTLENVGYSNAQPVYDANGEVDLAASRRVSFRFIVNVDF